MTTLGGIFMKKGTSTICIILCIVLLFSLTACGCDHSYASKITKEATCTEAGVKTYTCELCGDSYTEDIAKLTTHSYTSKVIEEATCKETGVRAYTCGVCGDSYTEDIEKLTTHSYTSEVTKEPTCSKTGIRTYTCGECGDSYTEEIAKTNEHTLTKNNICSRCGYGNTINLNMSEEEKAKASSVKKLWHKTNILSGDGCYIIRFTFSTSDSSTKDSSTFIAVPVIIDISITNKNNQVVYSNVKAVKTEDYEYIDGELWCSVHVNYNELTDITTKIDKISYAIVIPGYFGFGIYEKSAPAIIILPTLPESITCYSFSYDTVVKVTDISYTNNSNQNPYLYFTGEKIHDEGGLAMGSTCAIGYKLYDMEGYLIKNGVCYIDDIYVGSKFKNQRCTLPYGILEAGVIYRLEIVSVF